MARLAQASVHGRFQPFHNGHLDYLRQAFEQAQFVYVGLTQIYLPRPAKECSTTRETSSGNPLSYFQRTRLVRAALHDEGIDERRYAVSPFPIETPERLIEFLPLHVPCFTTRLNEWNDEKVKRLRSVGYDVRLLDATIPDRRRVGTGTHIREFIRLGDNRWTSLVPQSVSKIINEEMLGSFLEEEAAADRITGEQQI